MAEITLNQLILPQAVQRHLGALLVAGNLPPASGRLGEFRNDSLHHFRVYRARPWRWIMSRIWQWEEVAKPGQRPFLASVILAYRLFLLESIYKEDKLVYIGLNLCDKGI
jgi:hypothetical protein